MSATLKDISNLTGINTGTISHVLNKHPKAQVVRAETRKRIFSTARELGYRRNELAATTRTGVNRTVALVGDFYTTFTHMNSVMSGLLVAATENDYGVRVYSPAKLDVCMDEIRSQRIKQVIVESLDSECREKMAEFCQKNNLHLTYIFEQSRDGLPVVATTDRLAMKAAVMRLVELGHRRIALLCAKHNFHYMDERHQGYLDGLSEAGISPDESIIDCSMKMRDTRRAIENMLQLTDEQKPTAFVCISDSFALQVEGIAMRNGLSVPDDISIIGFGNADFGEHAIPPFSTIAQPFEEMGKVALEIALGKNRDIKANEKNEYLLPTKFIERESVAKCKKRIKN